MNVGSHMLDPEVRWPTYQYFFHSAFFGVYGTACESKHVSLVCYESQFVKDY